MAEWEEMKMVEEYFARTDFYREKLGDKTIVLFQSGSFYEVYGYKKQDSDGRIQGSLIEEFSRICDMQISEKKASYKDNTLYMAGFGVRDWQLEKYKNRLLEHKYTVVVIIQLEEMQSSGAKKKKRELEGIYSPGTFIPPDTKTQWSNHMMCVWIQSYQTKKGKTEHMLGIAILNIVTNQSYLLEYTILESKLQATSFDDLERCISIYNPKELILITSLNNLESFVPSLQNIYVHRYDGNMDIVKNAGKQVYCRHIVSKYFGSDAISQCAEFSTYELATQSFCVLVHFLEEHNPQLCKRIKLPLWENQSKTVLLANHTLTQLNILNTNTTNTSSSSSVHDLTNKCITRMGNRAFLHTLTHPTFDVDVLELEYNTMDLWIHDERETMEMLHKRLYHTYDLSSLSWSVTTQKIVPSALYKIYKTVETTQQIWTCMADMGWMHTYIGKSYEKSITELKTCLDFLEKRLILENCMNQTQCHHFDAPILKPGLFPALDELYKKHETQIEQLNIIWVYLERQMSPNSKKGEFVKYNQSDKHGVSFQMTKLRCDALKKKMVQEEDKIVLLEKGVAFCWKDVTFHPTTTKNTMDIRFPVCDEICKSLSEFKTEVDTMTHTLYLDIVRELDLHTLDLCSHILSKVDVMWTKCLMAIRYNYCRPTIDRDVTKSYIDAKGLRHVLIERLLQDELYVPNDICLGKGDAVADSKGDVVADSNGDIVADSTKGDAADGILLFGTNAVGKTSLMRALGIAVIMAQAGMYVPCSSFVYHPYRSIYSRILSQDNLFKGLSTFAVEMSELRVIHQYADKHSLILGDELCSGTETTSALCIVMASLIRFHERKASFLLATHFHEIIDYPELKELERIRCCHLAVSYDEVEDCLVYERILQDGPGLSNYGLEVCKSLYMDKNLMETAYAIRKKHFTGFEGSLSFPQTKYNVEKIRGICEKCKKVMGKETHHMQEQQYADEKGFMNGGFHKNHPANLMALCESCHLAEHHQHQQSSRRVKTTKGFVIRPL